METKKKAYPHAGHRQRIIAKIETQALCDHELLEVLLFNGLPRQNTNELAHRLLIEFGSLEGVINATLPALQKVEGVGESLAAYIRVIGLVMRQCMQEKSEDSLPKKFSYDTFMPFLKRAYTNVSFEVLDAYALDDTGEIISRKRFSSSMLGKVEIEAQELMHMIYAQSPTGIVLVHNHPSGEAYPSKRDDVTTVYLQKICEENGVMLCDHLIYAQSGVYSYNLNGRMGKLGDLYAQKHQNLLGEFLEDVYQ